MWVRGVGRERNGKRGIVESLKVKYDEDEERNGEGVCRLNEISMESFLALTH